MLINLNHNHIIHIHARTHIHIHTDINDKNDNSNERKWSKWLKEILVVACTFCTACMDIQTVFNSLFLILTSQGSMTVSIPLVLNLIFLGLETIQYCDRQSAVDVFQKYLFYKDYTNMFWTKMFLLEFWRQTLVSFKHFHCQNLQISLMYWNIFVFI